MAHDSRSVLSRGAPPPQLTVRYGERPDQVIDIWLPPPRSGSGDSGPAASGSAAPDGAPLVVFLHGGFWRAEYDRLHVRPLAVALAERGYAVATPEYRRTGSGAGAGGGWPATFDDVAQAVRALPALLADDARVRPGPMLVSGHSAGGHLALWVPTAIERELVAGVVALAPVADLAAGYRLDLDGGAVAALLGGGPDDQPQRYAQADPIRRLPAGVPLVLVHGDQDRQVPVELSERFAAAARQAGDEVRIDLLPDTDHFAVIDPLSPAWPRVLAAYARLATPAGPR